MRKGKPAGFTLIELLVVIAIISLLVSILLPSLERARDLARSAVCASNVKQIGLTIALYAEDNDEHLPCIYRLYLRTDPYQHYLYQLREYVDAPGLFRCPAGRSTPLTSIPKWFVASLDLLPDYGINNYFRYSHHYRIGQIDKLWGFLMDGQNPPPETRKYELAVSQIRIGHWRVYPGSWWGAIATRHSGGANVLFTDFHVESGPFEHWYYNVEIFGGRQEYHPEE